MRPLDTECDSVPVVLSPPDLPSDEAGVVLLSDRMLALDGKDGRSASGKCARSWCLSPPPPPIMRLRKPLFLGLIAFVGAIPTAMSDGERTPRRLESESLVESRVRGSLKREQPRSTAVSSGGVEAALR